MEENKQIITQLDHLIQVNLDRRAMYENAMEDVTEIGLMELFSKCIAQSEKNIVELRPYILKYGGKSPENPSTSSKLSQMWMDFKAAVIVDNERAVLQSCEKGEDTAKDIYLRAADKLEEDMNDEELRSIIIKQKAGILAIHDHIRALRDSFKEDSSGPRSFMSE